MRAPKPTGHAQVLHVKVPVYVVPVTHPVLQDETRGQLDGAYLLNDGAIWLNGNLSLEILRENFMHELHHAMITIAGLNVSREEYVVNHLSPVLCGTLIQASMLRWPRWLKPL